MNKVILQLWEESERGWGVRPDGCSLHTDLIERDGYLKSIYDDRGEEVPYEYDRIVGGSIYAFVDDDLFKSLSEEKTVRITQNSLNNLISLNELIIKE
jgi:hypothetical protein